MSTYTLYIHGMLNFVLIFSIFLGYMVHLRVFSNHHKMPKHFPIYLLKVDHINGPVQFKLVLFKGQLYNVGKGYGEKGSVLHRQ